MKKNFSTDGLVIIASKIDNAMKGVIPASEYSRIDPRYVVSKPAIGAIILDMNWKDANHFSELRMLLAKSKKTNMIEVFGGGVSSKEEDSFQAMFTGAEFPEFHGTDPVKFAGPYYHFQCHSLLTKEKLSQPTISENEMKAAQREILEEGMSGIEFVTILPEKHRIGVPFLPKNPNIKRVLEKKFPALYSDSGQLKMVQVVEQTAILATSPAESKFHENDEVLSPVWLTVEQIVALGRRRAGLMNNTDELGVSEYSLRNSVPIHFIKWLYEYFLRTEIFSS